MAIVINSETGLAEDLPDEHAASALQSGTHNRLLSNQQGELINVPEKTAQEYLHAGYTLPTPDQLQSQYEYAQRNTPSELAKGYAEAGGRAATFGLLTPVEQALGVDTKDIAQRQEFLSKEHPTGKFLTEAGSLAATAPLGGFGAANILGRAGEGAAAGLGLGAEGAGLLSKVGASATKGAVEGALYQSGNQVSEAFLDPNSIETAIPNIGLAAIYGGAIGGGLGSVHPIVEAAHGLKAGQVVSDFVARAKEKINNPTPQVEFSEQLQNIHDSMSAAKDTSTQKVHEDFIQSIGGTPDISPVQAGEKIKQSLLDAAETERDATSALYKELNMTTKEIPIRPDGLKKIGNNILKIPEVNQFMVNGRATNPAASLAQGIVDRLENVKTLDDLDTQIKSIRGELGFSATPNEKRIASIIRDKLDGFYERILDEQFKKSDRNDLIDLRQESKKRYSELIGKLQNIGEATGKKRLGSVGDAISYIQDIPSEKLADRLFVEKNAGLLNEIKTNFPKEFEILSDYQRGSIVNTSMKDGVFNPEKAIKQIDSLSPEVRKTLFNKDQISSIDKLKKSEVVKANESIDPIIKDLRTKFMEVGADGKFQPSESKITQFFNSLGKASSETRKTTIDNTIKALEKYQEKVPTSPVSMNALKKSLDKMSAGSRLFDKLAEHGAAKIGGAGIGAAIGSIVGHPWIGALMGEHTISPVLENVLPSLARSFLEKDTNGVAARSAIDVGMAHAKGYDLIKRASKNLFNSGKDVLPSHLIPDEKKRKKLDKTLQSLNLDPSPLFDVGSHASHYLPEHSSAMAQTALRASQYLNSIRPKPPQGGPLDSGFEVSQEQQHEYDRQLDIANQPLLAVQAIKDGDITSKDITTFKTIYPSLYASVSKNLLSSVIDQKSKETDIPYHIKMGLSLFLGQPLDSTMTPQSILANQSQVPTKNTEEQNVASKQMKIGQAKGLDKISSLYKTDSQARLESKNRA